VLASLTGHLGNLEKKVSSPVAWNCIQGVLQFTEAVVTKVQFKLHAEAILSGDGVILWSERSWF
jgi:hypothetical protein